MLTKGCGEGSNDEDRSRTDEAPSDVSAAHTETWSRSGYCYMEVHESLKQHRAQSQAHPFIMGGAVMTSYPRGLWGVIGLLNHHQEASETPTPVWSSRCLRIMFFCLTYKVPLRAVSQLFSVDVTHHICLGLILMFCVALWSSAAMRHTLAKTQQPPFVLSHRA